MAKEQDQHLKSEKDGTSDSCFSETVTKLLQEISDILPTQAENPTENLKKLYKKYIDKGYTKQFANLPKDIQKKLVNDTISNDEFHDIFQQYISIPILEQTLKQLQQKCEIGASFVEFQEHDVEKIFTDKHVKQDILETLSVDSRLNKYLNIFDSQTLQKGTDTWLACLCNRLSVPINASQQTTQNKPFLDLGDFVIVGDIDCHGYKMPKSASDIKKLLKILPLAVIGKFICSGWDKNLFAQINKLPFAETIDCSFSVNSLDDLIGKIPNGLSKLIVQETLIKQNSLQSDPEKLDSAKKIMQMYPCLTVTDTKEKYNLHETVQQITSLKETTNHQLQKQAATKTVVKTEQKKPVKKQEKTFSIQDVIAMFPETNQTILLQWIENEIKDKHKSVDQDTGNIHLTQKAVNRIADLVVKEKTTQHKQTKTESILNKTADIENTNATTQKSQNRIHIYIKQNDLDKDADLQTILSAFNVWPQPDYISKKSKKTCCFINADGKELLLNGLKLKTATSLSYGINASRHDFKLTKLIDIDKNGEIKTVTDESGKEIFVMVCVKYFKKHEKYSKDTLEHNRIINNLDVYVTPKPLTKSQQNKICADRQHGDNSKKFFSLSELDATYVKFTYDPNTENKQKSKKDVSLKPVLETTFEPSVKPETKNENVVIAPTAQKKVKKTKTKTKKAKTMLDVTAVEKTVNAWCEMLQNAKQELDTAKQELVQTSGQITEKINQDDFDSLQDLYNQAKQKTDKVIMARQNVYYISERFDKAKFLLEQRTKALAEKEAAEQSLQSAENEIKQFLQETSDIKEK